MNKVDGYGVYQNPQYDSKVNSRKEEPQNTGKKAKTERTEKTGKKQVQLSDSAKKLLEELKKKYGNMDFFVADYSSNEEAQSYLSRGSKQYSVLIEPDVLEQMASDEDTKNKYLGIIDGATEQIDEVKEQLSDDTKNVKNMGFTVSKDGSVSFFADLEKSSEMQRERIEKAREEKREARGNGRAKSDYGRNRTDLKRATVWADSVKELVKKIRAVDWNSVKAEKEERNGRKFDFSI